MAILSLSADPEVGFASEELADQFPNRRIVINDQHRPQGSSPKTVATTFQMRNDEAAVDSYRGRGLVLEALLLAIQQFIEFLDQLQETEVVLFFLNQCAQLVHAFAFVWSHRAWDDPERVES